MILCTFLSFKDLIPWINATSHYKQEKNFIFKDVGASTRYFLCSSDLHRSLENLYNNGPRFTNIRKASLFFPRHRAMCLAWSTKIFTLKIIFFSWGPSTIQLHHLNPLKLSRSEYKNRVNLLFAPNLKSSKFLLFQCIKDIVTEWGVLQHKPSQGKLWRPEFQFQKSTPWSALMRNTNILCASSSCLIINICLAL